MRVLALRADAGGCAHYRVKLPAAAVQQHDSSISIDVRATIDVEAEQDKRTQLVRVREVKEDVDLIIFQRPLDNAFTAVIEQAQRQGIACVVEIDDDFANVHPRNHVWRSIQPDVHPHSNYEWVQRACELADLVTVSTDELRKYAPHGRVAVLPNFIPRRDTELVPTRDPRVPQQVTVGWSGTVQTHPNDLQETRPGVAQAVRDTDARFYVVGDGEGVREALGLPKSVPFSTSGWVSLEQYMQRITDTIDVGIVPLEDTPFNHGKSWLKGLEFAAAGKPFVASPLPEYRKLRDEYGIGLLAATPSEWRKLTRDLVNDNAMRTELGEQWRATVREKLAVEDHGQLWIDAWRRAIAYREIQSKS